MVTVSSAQVWTVIGLFFTVLAGGQALVLRTVRAELGKAVAELRGEMREGFARIDATLAAHATRLEGLEAK